MYKTKYVFLLALVLIPGGVIGMFWLADLLDPPENLQQEIVESRAAYLQRVCHAAYGDQYANACRIDPPVSPEVEKYLLGAAQAAYGTNCTRLRDVNLMRKEARGDAEAELGLIRIGQGAVVRQRALAESYNDYMESYRDESPTAQGLPATMPTELDKCLWSIDD